MTFYPIDVADSPGWSWGWDMFEHVDCDLAGDLAPLLITPASTSAMRVISFQDVPYGIAFDFAGSSTLTPYQIDPATLQIALGTPISGPYAGFGSDLAGAYVLDANTMVVQRLFVGGTGVELYVVTRTGLSLSISGPSGTVTTDDGLAFMTGVDATHLVRSYHRSASPHYIIVEVLSVSGGVVSVVHTDSISATWTATVDPSGLPSAMSDAVYYPFHCTGSMLYAYCNSTSASVTLFGPGICATPFSIAGGIGAIGLSTRVKDSQNVVGFINLPGGKKIASTESLLNIITGAKMPMWDDGTHIHYTLSSTATWMFAAFIGHNDETGDSGTTQGDYLTGNVVEYPAGVTINSGPALVTQSGEALSYTPITPRFLCPVFGTDIQANARGSSTRHGSNLGCQIIDPTASFGPYLLRAFSW